ncbi:sodium ion-translocating decarboxylase subunit beta [Syntrophus sp. (in: bacteria)]|uniref:sodium ion-translocating decarboxylase subunit beta n=1 Tax=Syntrophus sp. (in: bacteria) TaxID=48412 RepID=UPI00345F120C
MEPLLLVPIGFGMILVNLPLGGMMDYEMMLRAPQAGTVMEVSMNKGTGFDKGAIVCKLDTGEVKAPVFGRVDSLKVSKGQRVEQGQVIASILTMEQTNQAELPSRPIGLLSRIFQFGVMWQILPPLMFLCLGALTDFGPMLANPKTLLLGAAAQFGVYLAFFMSLFFGFSLMRKRPRSGSRRSGRSNNDLRDLRCLRHTLSELPLRPVIRTWPLSPSSFLP